MSKARWRKIGPLIGSQGSRYQRMRLIQQKAWTHPPVPLSSSIIPISTTTPATQRPVWSPSSNVRHSSTPAQVFNQDAQRVHSQPTQIPSQARTQVTAAQMAFRATQPTTEPESTAQANNIRRFAFLNYRMSILSLIMVKR